VLALSRYEDKMFRPRPARVSRRSRPSRPLLTPQDTDKDPA
jgi:hypothetical protein